MGLSGVGDGGKADWGDSKSRGKIREIGGGQGGSVGVGVRGMYGGKMCSVVREAREV
jgi:hypothetical protein